MCPVYTRRAFRRLIHGRKRGETVGDCLSREFGEVREDKPLFDTVREVIHHGVVVVRARDGCLCGLVTLRDIADVFVELSEPFRFLGQIENHLRELVERMRLTPEQLRALTDERDVARAAAAAKVDDFTLGELIRAIQNPDYWAKLNLNHDRAILLKRDGPRAADSKQGHAFRRRWPSSRRQKLSDRDPPDSAGFVTTSGPLPLRRFGLVAGIESSTPLSPLCFLLFKM